MKPQQSLEVEYLEAVENLSRDLVTAAATLTKREVRYLVDQYYIMQRDRIRAANQLSSLAELGEPHQILHWLSDQAAVLEKQTKRALYAYAKNHPVGEWLLGIVGVGPVIASGLLAHIDIEKAPTVGRIWRFAGLDPTVKWEKGQKRPWNARLKVLCWKAGKSFVQHCNNQKAFYGPLYLQRKALEVERNDTGQYAEQAKAALLAKKYGKDTEAYKAYIQGKLPDAHLHARATRWVVKLFLSHVHTRMYEAHYGTPPPKPWMIEHGGHVDYIPPPP
jgi:hypothetical protein